LRASRRLQEDKGIAVTMRSVVTTVSTGTSVSGDSTTKSTTTASTSCKYKSRWNKCKDCPQGYSCGDDQSAKSSETCNIFALPENECNDCNDYYTNTSAANCSDVCAFSSQDFKFRSIDVKLKGMTSSGNLQLLATYHAPVTCTADTKFNFKVDVMDYGCNHVIHENIVEVNASAWKRINDGLCKNINGAYECTTVDLQVKLEATKMINGNEEYKFCLYSYFEEQDTNIENIPLNNRKAFVIVKSTENDFTLDNNVTNIDPNINTDLASSDKIEVMFCSKDNTNTWKSANSMDIKTDDPATHVVNICMHPDEVDKSYECKRVDKLVQQRKKGNNPYGQETVRWVGGSRSDTNVKCDQTGEVSFNPNGTPNLSATKLKSANGDRNLPNGCYCQVVISPDYFRSYDSVRLSGAVTIQIAEAKATRRLEQMANERRRRLQEEYFSVGLTVENTNDEAIDAAGDFFLSTTLGGLMFLLCCYS